MGVISCNLCWWCFFIQPLMQTLYLHSGNLHCVVEVNGGGCCMWRWRWRWTLNAVTDTHTHQHIYLHSYARTNTCTHVPIHELHILLLTWTSHYTHTLLVLVIVFTTARLAMWYTVLAVVHSHHARSEPSGSNNTGQPIGSSDSSLTFVLIFTTARSGREQELQD